ncbi:MAG: hypothetical protein WCK42_03625 [Myxococcaceae bacterium]
MFQFIMNAASRGRFSDEEIRHIEAQKINLKKIRANAYITALSFIEMTHSAYAEEIAEIDKIQAVLKIPDDEIQEPKKQL